MRVLWICKKCDGSGSFSVDNHETIINVYSRINDDHYQQNRFCEYDWSYIRISLVR